LGDEMSNNHDKALPWLNATDDREFADGALTVLPNLAAPTALEARILADFDHVAAHLSRRRAHLMDHWRDVVWPGAPIWKPASVLAVSLLIGLVAGALVPSADLRSDSSTQNQASLSPYDSSPALDMSKDL
jgi:hypothetical protein